jgi:hypothetical protein
MEATDKGLKNRWRWSSLSENDKDGIDWREWCRKTDIAGTRKKQIAKCRLNSYQINEMMGFCLNM